MVKILKITQSIMEESLRDGLEIHPFSLRYSDSSKVLPFKSFSPCSLSLHGECVASAWSPSHFIYNNNIHMNCTRAHEISSIYSANDLSSHVCSNIKMKIRCAKVKYNRLLRENEKKSFRVSFATEYSTLHLAYKANCLIRITQQIPTERNGVNNRRRITHTAKKR